MPFNPNAIPDKAFQPSTSWHVPLSQPNVASDEPELPTEILSASTSNDADTRSNEFQTVQPSTSKHSDWSAEVDSVFDIEPVTIDSTNSKSKSRIITTHRILTSDDIINVKRDGQNASCNS